jgi:hypothetical protein
MIECREVALVTYPHRRLTELSVRQLSADPCAISAQARCAIVAQDDLTIVQDAPLVCLRQLMQE